MNGEMLGAIAVMSMFGAFGYLFHIILKWRQSKYRLSVQLKMMDKIGNGDELVRLADSESGRKFLDSLQLENVGMKEKMISAVYKGVILVLLGFTLFLVRGVMTDAVPFFSIASAIALAFGLGYLIATGASYKLASKWGLIESNVPGEDL